MPLPLRLIGGGFLGVERPDSLLSPPFPPLIRDLERANLRRAQYLLRHYFDYSAQQPPDLSLSVSQAVLEILSFSLSDHPTDTPEDDHLIDRCGSFLAPAILHAAEKIKGFPMSVRRETYPVLYWQYLSLDGPAVDTTQLLQRLKTEGLLLSAEEAQRHLADGERMMSALLFPNPFLSAMLACS